MKEEKIWCDCCGDFMEEVTASELSGQLGVEEEENAINFDDLCEGCSAELIEAISDVSMRRSN